MLVTLATKHSLEGLRLPKSFVKILGQAAGVLPLGAYRPCEEQCWFPGHWLPSQVILALGAFPLKYEVHGGGCAATLWLRKR